MKVILLENIRKIGSIGDIIEVKRGFARNFLIANKKTQGKKIQREKKKLKVFLTKLTTKPMRLKNLVLKIKNYTDQ